MPALCEVHSGCVKSWRIAPRAVVGSLYGVCVRDTLARSGAIVPFSYGRSSPRSVVDVHPCRWSTTDLLTRSSAMTGAGCPNEAGLVHLT
jgi:hypothetical protein